MSGQHFKKYSDFRYYFPFLYSTEVFWLISTNNIRVQAYAGYSVCWWMAACGGGQSGAFSQWIHSGFLCQRLATGRLTFTDDHTGLPEDQSFNFLRLSNNELKSLTHINMVVLINIYWH